MTLSASTLRRLTILEAAKVRTVTYRTTLDYVGICTGIPDRTVTVGECLSEPLRVTLLHGDQVTPGRKQYIPAGSTIEDVS